MKFHGDQQTLFGSNRPIDNPVHFIVQIDVERYTRDMVCVRYC